MIPRVFHASAHARKLFVIITSIFCFTHDSVPKFSVPVCLNSHSRSFHLLYPCHSAPYQQLFVLLFLLLTGHGSVPKLRVPACRFLKIFSRLFRSLIIYQFVAQSD